jgi:hypothetical protein
LLHGGKSLRDSVETRIWSIGEAAREVKRSVVTLRRWQAAGLIAPVHDGHGNRFFTGEQLVALHRLAEARAGPGRRRKEKEAAGQVAANTRSPQGKAPSMETVP